MFAAEDILRMTTTKELVEHLTAEIDAIILAGELDKRIDEVMRLQNFIFHIRDNYPDEGDSL